LWDPQESPSLYSMRDAPQLKSCLIEGFNQVSLGLTPSEETGFFTKSAMLERVFS
jgi:hypothetical protein